jgi:hypothetical protein
MYKIEGGNVQKGLAQSITQRNYRVFSSTGIFALRDHSYRKNITLV